MATLPMLFTEKYTPKCFDDFDDFSDAFVQILKHFVQINFGSFLFVGPNGCGKTLMIEIFLNEYFSRYPKHVKMNEYILRINVLKEQGIHFYRNDLKYFCQNISTIQKFVVMDDLDYLNEHSQQVIRNCIQKYSNNIHFIASCTNSKKVTETLNSMLLPIRLKTITSSVIEKLFERVVLEEHLDLTDDAKKYILQTRNNPKKLLIDLQKCKLYGERLHLDDIKNLLYDINHQTFDLFTETVKEGNRKKASQILLELYEEGFSVIDILSQYYEYMKFCESFSDALKYKITKIVTKFVTIFHNLHEDSIELTFFAKNIVDTFAEKI